MVNISGKYSTRLLWGCFLFIIAGVGLSLWLFVPFYSDSAFIIPKAPAGSGVELAAGITETNLFGKVPALYIWLLFITIGFAFSFAMIYEAYLMYRKLHRVFEFPVRQLASIVLGVMGLIILFVFLPTTISSKYHMPLAPPIEDFSKKLRLYLLFSGISSALCIAGIIITGNIAFNLRKKLCDDGSTTYFSTLQQSQMQLLVLLGAQLTVGILATASMHEMHNELYGDKQVILTQQGVAVEGIFYTFILGIFFIPARRELQRFGYRIVDKECGTRPAEGKNWKEWGQEREALIELLGLKLSVKGLATWAIPVLAPLITSVLPKFLHTS